jgi:hypothetical protein
LKEGESIFLCSFFSSKSIFREDKILDLILNVDSIHDSPAYEKSMWTPNISGIISRQMPIHNYSKHKCIKQRCGSTSTVHLA